MIKFLHGVGQGALYVTFGALALTVSASAQGYPQPYPAPAYPPANYPRQAYPAQSAPYPGQQYPAQGYQNYPSRSGQPQVTQAQPSGSSPVCVRLEAQLAGLNGGNANIARQAQIQQAEQALAKQQADLDRMVAQARRAGCSGGFLSLFSGFSPSCAPLNSKIDKMRGDLDNQMSSLEQLKSGGNGQEAQRTALVGQLAQNNCGSQYTQAARAAGPQGFFEALLGNGTVINPTGNGAPAGTYRTICVRSCDGFYFPISYSTVPARFAADAQACQRLCPGAEVALYSYRNPGDLVQQAVSISGAPYTALPNAFRYRKEIVAGCSCRKPGESWAQALRNADDSSTLERGDIVVTDKNEKALTRIPASVMPKRQPQAQSTTPGTAAAPAAAGSSGSATTSGGATDAKNRKVRVVGPPLL